MLVGTMKQAIFAVIVLIIIILVFSIIAFQEAVFQSLLWIALLVLFILFVANYDVILMLKDYERAVIFRFGKVHRVGGPGWCIVIPFIELPNIVDLRVHTIDVPRQQIITKDKIELNIDSIIYIAVNKDKQSAINSVVAVENYKDAVVQYAVAALRDVMGSMALAEVLVDIEGINSQLTKQLIKISEGWGVRVDAVQIKDIDIPKIVIDAMHMEKAAEQEKLARIEKAMAHKAEIAAVKEAAEGLSEKAIAYYYIRALEKMAKGKSTKFIFPMEFSKLAENISGSAKALGAVAGAAAGAAGITLTPELLEKYAPVLKKLQESAGAKKGKSKGQKEKVKGKKKKKRAGKKAR